MKKKDVPAKTGSASHTQMAYEGIRHMLFTNQITPGRKISYRQLADHLGMSLTPVIQALKTLEFQGLVRYEPNRGYSTRPMSMQEVQEIYDMRELIEVSLLPDVIANLSETGIRKLKRLLETGEEPGDEQALNRRLLRDREFHMTLAALSGKRIPCQMLDHLFDLLYLKYRASILFVHSRDPVGSQHKYIFDAVVSQDLDRAAAALRDHFRDIRAQALQALARLLAEEV